MAWISQTITEIETGIFLKAKTRDPLINDLGLVRDQFNLHKIIFVVTQRIGLQFLFLVFFHNIWVTLN